MKNEIKEVLMKRDGYNKHEAETELNMMREEFYSIVDNGGNLEDVEELLYSEGLELFMSILRLTHGLNLLAHRMSDVLRARQ